MSDVMYTMDGTPVTKEEREFMLDMIDKYGVVEYAEYKGYFLAIFETNSFYKEYGVQCAGELNAKLSNHKWLACSYKLLEDNNIIQSSIFSDCRWLLLEEEEWKKKTW